MDDFERKVIQEHFAQLKRELVPGDLADLMYSKGIIGREVLDEVEAIPIQDKKNRRLLMALEDSPNQQAFSLFLKCIDDGDSVLWPIATQLRGEKKYKPLPVQRIINAPLNEHFVMSLHAWIVLVGTF